MFFEYMVLARHYRNHSSSLANEYFLQSTVMLAMETLMVYPVALHGDAIYR